MESLHLITLVLPCSPCSSASLWKAGPPSCTGSVMQISNFESSSSTNTSYNLVLFCKYHMRSSTAGALNVKIETTFHNTVSSVF